MAEPAVSEINQLIEKVIDLIKEAEDTQNDFMLNNLKIGEHISLVNQNGSRWFEKLDAIKRASRPNFELAVMGEFRSGKSTLVNALIGRNIAPTDILECTCVLSSFSYGPNEQVTCFFKNKAEEKKYEIVQALQLLEEHRGDIEWAKQIKHFSFEISDIRDRNIFIWDTPGVGATTKENEDLAREFIDQADAVIWVFNASLLGQSSLIEFIDRLSQKDKYLLAVINRIDQFSSGPERAIGFISRIYGNRFKHILPLTAIKAITLDTNDDGGLSKLLNILDNEVYANKLNIKHRAVAGDLGTLIEQYISELDTLCWTIDQQLSIYEDLEKNLGSQTSIVEQKIDSIVVSFIEAEFFAPYLTELENLLCVLDQNEAKPKDYHKVVDTIFSSNVESLEMDRLFLRVKEEEEYLWRNYFFCEQQRVEKSLDLSIHQIPYDSVYEISSSDLTSSVSTSSHQLNKFFGVIVGVVKSASEGALGGGIFSGVLGAIVAAASTAVTITAIPVFALSGSVLGGAFGVKYFFDNLCPELPSVKIIKDITARVMNRRKELLAPLREHINVVVKSDSKNIKSDFLRQYCQSQLNGVPPDRLSFHGKKLKKIRSRLNEALRETEELRIKLGSNINTRIVDDSSKEEVWDPKEPEVVFKKLLRLLKQSKGYLKINDRHFGPEQLLYLQQVDSDIPIYIMLFKFDDDQIKISFIRELSKLRRSRKGSIYVRLVSYSDRPNTPIHDRYIFTSDAGYNLSSSLNAIGRHHIRVHRLINPKKEEENHFNLFWEFREIQTAQGTERLTHIDL